jgi:hypothetical protein
MPSDSPEPEVVYHYTTMETMKKMVEKPSIWATSLSYLNDVSEGEHFLKLICERLPVYRETHLLDDPGIFDKIEEKDILGFEGRPFVASFSQDDDSLPQWRAYCPNGNGVAVGFRVECLKRAFIEPKDEPNESVAPYITFMPVEYIDGSDLESLDQEIDSVLVAVRILAERHAQKGLSDFPASRYFRFLIQRMACFKKHPAFSNEHEYRLIVDSAVGHRELLEYRPTRSTIVPYIPVSIPREHSSHTGSAKNQPRNSLYSSLYSPLVGRWQYIDRVVIGPSPNKELSRQAVESLFKKHSMDVEVKPSEIPYRDW